jgi:hypothetical protein
MGFMFWRDWSLGEKIAFFVFLSVMILALSDLMLLVYEGEQIFSRWDLKGQIEILSHPLMSFSYDFFEMVIPTDSFLIINRFVPTFPQISAAAYVLPFLLYVLGLLVVITSSTYLSGFSYLTTLVVWVLGVAAFDFDGMGIYFDFLPDSFMEGRKSKLYFYLILGSYLPINFLLQNFENRIGYLFRFLIFVFLTVLFGFSLMRYATTGFPVVHAWGYGISVPIFASLLFLSFAAHEPIRGFLVMVGANGQRGYRQWMVFSIVYLFNVVYAYLYYVYGLDWGIYFLDPFVLSSATCLLGVWGTFARRGQYQDLIEAPYAVFMFMGLSFVFLSQLILALQTTNDPLISLYRSVILVSHFGFGLAFIFFIILNFKELFDAFQPVFKVTFNPKKLDFWLVWTFGLIVLFGAFFGNYKKVYHTGVSASYNIIGSRFYLAQDLKNAKENWDISQRYSPSGRFNNYMLASLALRENKKEFIVADQIKKATRLKASPLDYAYIAELYAQDELKLFQAIFSLEEGLKKFPQSGELHNNLALLYNKTNLADSVWKFFDKARMSSQFSHVVEANYYALWAKYRSDLSLDSLYLLIKPKRYVGTLANEAAFLNATGKINTQAVAYDLLPDSALDTKSLTYLYNLSLNEGFTQDTVLSSKIEFYLFNGKNEIFQTNLQVALAVLYFKRGKIDNAFSLMELAVEGSLSTDAYTPLVLGSWLLLAQQYERAVQFLSMAYARGNDKAMFPLALAYTYSKNPKALESWSFLSGTNGAYAQVAQSVLKVLYANRIDPLWTDLERYYALRFGKWIQSDEMKILAAIGSKTFRDAYAESKVLEATEPSEAQYYFDLITQPSAEAELALMRLKGQFDARFAKLLESPISIYRVGHIQHYKALYQQFIGDSLAAAKAYEKALDMLPLKISVYSDAAAFYARNPEKAYDLVIRGLRLNPRSSVLLEKYILLCFELKLDNFARRAYQDWLALELPIGQKTAFEKLYAEKLKISEQLPEGWE